MLDPANVALWGVSSGSCALQNAEAAARCVWSFAPPVVQLLVVAFLASDDVTFFCHSPAVCVERLHRLL